MSIRLRLLCGFGILIIAMIGITLLSIAQIGGIKERLDSIVDSSARRVYLAEKLKTDILSTSILEKNIILADTTTEAKQSIWKSEKSQASVDTRIAQLSQISEANDKQTLQQISSNWREYIAVTETVHDLATMDSYSQARRVSEGEALTAFDATMKEILNLMDSNAVRLRATPPGSKLYELLMLERSLLAGIENTLFSMQESEQNLLDTRKNSVITKYIDQLEQSESLLKDYFRQLAEKIPKNSFIENPNTRYRWLKNHYTQFLRANKSVRNLIKINPRQQAHEILNTKGEDSLSKVRRDLDIIIAKNDTQMSADKEGSRKSYQNTKNILWLSLATILGICAVVSFLLARSITRPLTKLRRVTQALAAGDVSVRADVAVQHEVGDLAKAFNEMAGMIDQRVKLQNRLSTLAQVLRGDQDIENLCKRTIQCLTELFKIHLGAIYVVKENELILNASVSLKTDTLPNTIAVGDGILGQAALELREIHISKHEDKILPEKFQSGIPSIQANSLSIYPLSHNDELAGLLVFGYLEDQVEADESFSTFFSQACESIAIALLAAYSRQTQSKLLAASQKQTEQLNSQQSRLATINEELEKQKRALETSKKLLENKADELDKASRYKSEFLANMSHELRSPLNSLLLLSKTLEKNEEGNLNSEQIHALRYIHSGGQELLSHINDILDLSKVEAGKLDFHFEITNIEEVCEGLMQTYTPQVREKNIELKLFIEAGLPTYIRTDRKRLIQVLRNLLSNAIKFTQEGSITLAFHRPSNPPKFIDNELLDSPPICFSVSDTGIGIPEEQTEAIFAAFQQADGSTSRKYGGTGLGLAISREFSKRLQGEIHVSSQVGLGSTFSLILPECADGVTIEDFEVSETRLTKEVHRSHQNGGSSEAEPEEFKDDRNDIVELDRVLLAIEDDLTFSKILYKYSHSKGFKCIIANTGEEGISLALTYKPTVITLDIGLPDLNGKSVLEKLKSDSNTQNIPIHIISSYDTSPEVKELSLEYLTKPVTNEDLEKLFDFVDNASSNVPASNLSLGNFATKTQNTTPECEKNPKKDGESCELSNKKVLLVDDDIRNMFALSKILSSEGMLVTKADNGELAVKKFKEAVADNSVFDIVLMDIMMPVMDGYQAIKNIRAFEKQCQLAHTGQSETELHAPIIALTAKAMAGDKEKCLQAGADNYLTKPLDETKLLNLMRDYLGNMYAIKLHEHEEQNDSQDQRI